MIPSDYQAYRGTIRRQAASDWLRCDGDFGQHHRPAAAGGENRCAPPPERAIADARPRRRATAAAGTAHLRRRTSGRRSRRLPSPERCAEGPRLAASALPGAAPPSQRGGWTATRCRQLWPAAAITARSDARATCRTAALHPHGVQRRQFCVQRGVGLAWKLLRIDFVRCGSRIAFSPGIPRRLTWKPEFSR